MRIAIYDVAAETGGALSVLKMYYEDALRDRDNEYLFIIGIADLDDAENVRVLRVPFAKRSWLHRVAYDLLFAHRDIKAFGADRIISLQNVMVPFCDQPQFVYMHNILPRKICDARFSLPHDTKLWIYQNVIGGLIIGSCRRADGVVVQASWIKERLIRRCGVSEEKIAVRRPSATPIPLLPHQRNEEVAKFIYPASAEPFKNHEVIVKACELLKKRGIERYRVVFTIKGDESKRVRALKRRTAKKELPVIFMGWLTAEELSKQYSTCDCLIFPSKIETFGLPLLEASVAGLTIIASDLDYAHEALKNSRSKTHFFPSENHIVLAAKMMEIII